MNAPVLDTLRCAQTLRSAGFPEEQAEAMAQVLGDALTDVATKSDLDRLETRLEEKIDSAVGAVKVELKADIAQLNNKLDSVNQRFDSFETSTQRQFEGVQRQLGSFADQLKFQARVTYAIGGVLIALVLGSLVAPHLSWGAPTTTLPIPTGSPTAEIHPAPAQTGSEAPTPPPST